MKPCIKFQVVTRGLAIACPECGEVLREFTPSDIDAVAFGKELDIDLAAFSSHFVRTERKRPPFTTNKLQ